MRLLPLRTNLNAPFPFDIPIGVYTAGSEDQQPITRLTGFSAKQLILSVSGEGCFRTLGSNHNNWDIVGEGSLLYIPDHLPHEYRPTSSQPWRVAYVTYIEKEPGWSRCFALHQEPAVLRLEHTARMESLLEQIWSHSGPDYEMWPCNELLFALLVELRKQTGGSSSAADRVQGRVARHPDRVVDQATRFLHDHLQLHFSLTELASYVGYSPKQLVRLFKQVLGTTPLHYLQRVRLQTAAELLVSRSDMSVKQVADYVGLEPIYFTRLFRRAFGTVPSKFGPRSEQDDGLL